MNIFLMSVSFTLIIWFYVLLVDNYNNKSLLFFFSAFMIYLNAYSLFDSFFKELSSYIQ